MIPGEIVYADGKITLNAGRETVTLNAANTGDRPITIGSHCHFLETNIKLNFFRPDARGYRLHIPAGDAMRFEPGELKEITLVRLAGRASSEPQLTAASDPQDS
ncbi:urease subunit beta [Streptomyces sp. x-80]|uniref:urease subunit beta n=1 Tax=Streptomyces sp. x-80 TaxID=2789282 RepID=UPI00397F50A1